MSALNGDRARFRKNRKRKLHHRQRIRALMTQLRKKADGDSSAAAVRSATARFTNAASSAASLAMANEGSPAQIGD